MSPTPKLRLRSSVPGRERWDVEDLIGKQGIADALEKALIAERGILSARVNPLTGRVLIQYDVESGSPRAGLLRDHIRRIVDSGVHTVELPPKPRRNGLLTLFKASSVSGGQVATAVALSVTVQLLAVARRFTLISTINVALTGSGATQNAGTTQKAVATQKKPPSMGMMTALLVAMTAVEGVLDHFRSNVWTKLSRDAEAGIREPLLKHLQHQDVSFFDRQGSGRMMNLVTNDVSNIGRFIESVGDDLVEAVISILWAGGMLLWVAPSLLGLALLPLPFVLVAAWGLGPLVAKRTATASAHAANYSQHLGNSLAGIIDIKNFTAEDTEAAKLAAAGRSVDESSASASSASSIQYQAVQGIFGAGFAVAIGFAGSLVLRGEVVPDRTLHVLYWFPNLMGSLARLQSLNHKYHSALRSAENILNVLDSQPQIVSGPVRLPAKPENCEIAFDSVGFAYEPGVPVLAEVSFTVKPGQMLAIVGPTGSGKSTLLRLLLRHYDVAEGSIQINGQDIRRLNLHDLRKAIGVVGQDVYLFQGTIRENVRYGRPGATEEDLDVALRNSGTRAFLPELPAGGESEVGERGQRLSGGQRQRIAIARALVKNAPVLALDEATSQLDYETEGIVQRSIRTSAQGRTLIVVAHRLSTIRRADEIIVLESGRIRERGTHDELVRSGGLYASLWKLQNGDPSHS